MKFSSYFLLVLATMFVMCKNCNGTLQFKELANGQVEKLKLSSCESCEVVVRSFERGMKRTSRMSFGGGDTAWQEKNLGSYKTSETRLIEILDELCKEDQDTKGVCTVLAEMWEHHFENWWMRDRKSFPDLKTYLCVATVKACNETEKPKDCPTGYTRDKVKGCVDVNECFAQPCKQNQYCLNNQGSYTCEFCDAACDGCFGEGPNMCKIVKKYFKLNKQNLLKGRNVQIFGLNFKYVLLGVPFLLVVPIVLLLKYSS